MLFQVIARARRRLLWNALAHQLAGAVVVALAVLVLLLLLGTDAVAWSWLIILPSVSLAAGVWMAFRRLPGSRPTAQLLDRRLELADSLSTAVFFAAPEQSGRCAEEFRRAQNEQAARIAGAVDLRGAIPVRMPRAVHLSAVLTLAAAGLFFVRYRTAARLDLRAPMAGIVQQILENTRVEVAKLVDEFLRPKTPDREEIKEASNRPPAADGESAEGKPSGTGESNSGERGAGQPEMAEEKPKADTFAGEQEQSEQGTPSPADARSGSQQNPSSQQANQGSQQQQQQGAGSQAASTSAGASMMNKLKDSIANLLSALNPQPGGSGGQQAKATDGRQSGKNRKQGAAESASASGEPGEGGSAQPGNAPPGGSGQGDKAEADGQKGSGAGRDDGSKEIREAEQLAAMGKLDTIFGKRSENVSGEFTVEAAPGPQSLRTPYAQRTAEHTSAETVAMRDEVPVAYQDYVKHYYELIREADATLKRSGRVMAASSRRPRADR